MGTQAARRPEIAQRVEYGDRFACNQRIVWDREESDMREACTRRAPGEAQGKLDFPEFKRRYARRAIIGWEGFDQSAAVGFGYPYFDELPEGDADFSEELLDRFVSESDRFFIALMDANTQMMKAMALQKKVGFGSSKELSAPTG